MSTIKDDAAAHNGLDTSLAARIRAERETRSWSLSELSSLSGVSRAMISKVERGEASPTAALLGRLSGAFGLTLSMLLSRAENDAAGSARLVAWDAQNVWRDPATGFVRRSLSAHGAQPELVLVELPPLARVPYPKAAHVHIGGQCIWQRTGELLFIQPPNEYRLKPGDCLELAPPADAVFANPSSEAVCSYLIASVLGGTPR